MSFQTRFPGMNDESNYPTPAKKRTGPPMWIRRVVILRHFAPGEEHVVRDINLRPGLNILWAKSNAVHAENDLFTDGLSGHTAGKTTFVRLIRYIFGDATFGNANQMQAIRRALPNAWVLGDVVIGNQNWIVCRPLKTTTVDSFVFSNVALESIFTLSSAEQQDFSVYQDAVRIATVAQLDVQEFPVSGKEISWHHFLAWLSRDQECRLGHLLSWRDPRSDSPSLQLDVADRAALVRSVLGFLDPSEQKVSIHHQKLKRERDLARERLPKLRYHTDQALHALSRDLGQPLPALGEMFFAATSQVINDMKRKELESLQAEQTPSPELIGQLERQWEEAVGKLSPAEVDYKDLEKQLSDAKKELELIDGKVTPERRLQILADLPLGRRFCNVPLNEAKEKKCPLAAAHITDLADRRAANQDESDLLALRKRIKILEERLSSKARERAQLKRQADEHHGKLVRARAVSTMHASLVAKITYESENRIERARQVFRAWESVSQCQKLIETLSIEIETMRDQLGGLRDLQSTNLGRFKRYFNHIVQAVLGRDVGTEIKVNAKGIGLTIERHGDCSSVAVDTVKIIAFDLAVLCASIEGMGAFPGILIHDGPREADLAAGLYKRIFDYVRNLEENCEKHGNINFQYIITTTEPPPSNLQCPPWLLYPVLDAAKPEHRLLGVDL